MLHLNITAQDTGLKDNTLFQAHNVKYQPLVETEKDIRLYCTLNKHWTKREKLSNTFQKQQLKVVFSQDQMFEKCLSKEFEEQITSSKERNASRSFRKVAENSLGYNKSGNYKQFIKKKLIKIYEKIECLMTLKLHCLHSNLNFFSKHMGDIKIY